MTKKKPEMVQVELIKTHIHARVVYKPGDIIEVLNDTAQRLFEMKIAKEVN